jgi:hypothetical protein
MQWKKEATFPVNGVKGVALFTGIEKFTERCR